MNSKKLDSLYLLMAKALCSPGSVTAGSSLAKKSQLSYSTKRLMTDWKWPLFSASSDESKVECVPVGKELEEKKVS
jgi:hypothetical protein